MIVNFSGLYRQARCYLSELIGVLGPSPKKKLAALLAAFIFMGNIELIGIALIGSFIALALHPENIGKTPLLQKVVLLLNIETDFGVVVLVGSVIIMVFFFKAISGYHVNRAIVSFSQRHQQRIKEKLLAAYLALPLEQALQRNSSSLLTGAQKHVVVFTNRILNPILKATAESILLLLIFTFLLVENTLVSLTLAFLLILISILYDKVVKRKVEKAGADAVFASKASTQVLTQATDGFKDIRIAGSEGFFLSQFDKYNGLYAQSAIYTGSLLTIPRYLVELSIVMFVVGFLILGLAIYGAPTPELISTAGIFAVSAIRVMSSITTLLSTTNNLRYGKRALSELYQDLREADGVFRSSAKGGHKGLDAQDVEAMSFSDRVCAEDVTYAYPGFDRQVLKDISICVRKGQAVGFVGTSGAGKTTLVDILLGLLKPQMGEVTVDGALIRDRVRSWTKRIAYIPQNVFLMDDTIAANIAFGVDPDNIDEARFRSAIRTAQLEEMIAALPQGEQTLVGERGARLSGGQRQRIAIARALYHDRDLLVMDEATAALDNETEHELVEAIRQLHGKITLIVIAHRLTTLRYCDTVYRLAGGRIVESGSYEEIIRSEKLFGADRNVLLPGSNRE